jgi:hypothetical protein
MRLAGESSSINRLVYISIADYTKHYKSYYMIHTWFLQCLMIYQNMES